MQPRRDVAGAGLAIGLGLVGLALVIAFDTSRMQVAPTYAKVGPQVFPYLTAVALFLTGVYFAVLAMRGAPDALRAEPGEASLHGLAAISAGLVLQVLLIDRLGFILSSALLFFCVAWGFGSTRYLRDAAVGIVLSVAAFVVFTRLLGLQLPPGILGRLFG